MKNILILVFALFLAVAASCNKISSNEEETFLSGDGVFILNEGNFRWGNGSLSYYSYDSAKIYNELFLNINERPLGDVPNSMIINDDNAYIVVNNSGKIEVVNRNTLKSISTITGLISPRNMTIVSDAKAYVTSIYSDSVTIINLADNSISGYINIRRSSESIIINGNTAYVSNWVEGNEIMVINTSNNLVIDSIQVGMEPETMVLDKNKMLWVLCNGGWARNTFAELDVINTTTNSIHKKIVFPDILTSPTGLCIDGKGETLYYLDGGVRQMNIASSSLPASALVSESGHSFYKLVINPVNSDIFVTDAADYQQKGYVMYYSNDGTLISTFTADVIPGQMCFKLNESFSN